MKKFFNSLSTEKRITLAVMGIAIAANVGIYLNDKYGQNTEDLDVPDGPEVNEVYVPAPPAGPEIRFENDLEEDMEKAPSDPDEDISNSNDHYIIEFEDGETIELPRETKNPYDTSNDPGSPGPGPDYNYNMHPVDPGNGPG